MSINDFERPSESIPLETTEETGELLWGRYIVGGQPNFKKNPTGKALRVAVLGSGWCGMAALAELIALERGNPTLITVVGLATDEPFAVADPNQLGRRRRENFTLWQHVDDAGKQELLDGICKIAGVNGVDCLTGSVSAPFFFTSHGGGVFFSEFAPDLIVKTTFGQILPNGMSSNTRHGVFEIYTGDPDCPSWNQFKDPLAAKIAQGARHTCITCFNPDGESIGLSDWVCLQDEKDQTPDWTSVGIQPLEVLHMRVAPVVANMTSTLVKYIVKNGFAPRPKALDFRENMRSERLMTPIEGPPVTRAEAIEALFQTSLRARP